MKYSVWIAIVCMGFFPLSAQQDKKKFVIIVPSYNNKQFFQKNIDSIAALTYDHYRVIYMDDCSPDGTGQLVKEYIKQKGIQDRFDLIINTIRCYALANIYKAVHSCEDDEICVFLDGDDWFAHEHVLEVLNEVYSKSNEQVWMTYGTYRGSTHAWEHCKDIPSTIVESNGYRSYAFVTSHLRTCYAGLFKHIQLKDFLYKNAFYAVTWDLAIMFPLLEMAGGRFHFIDSILYIYNTDNPISDMYQRHQEQLALEEYIRKQPMYRPLVTSFYKEESVHKQHGALLIVASQGPEQLHAVCEKQKALLKKYKDKCYVVSTQTDEAIIEEYKIICAQYEMHYVDNNLLSVLSMYNTQRKKSAQYVLIMSDSCMLPFTLSINRAIDLMNQTDALTICLSDKYSLIGDPTKEAYWAEDCVARQYSSLNNDSLSSGWAYMLNVSELNQWYGLAKKWKWDFWHTVKSRTMRGSSSNRNQIMLFPVG